MSFFSFYLGRIVQPEVLEIRPEMKVDLEIVLESGNGPRNGSDEVVPEEKRDRKSFGPNRTGIGSKADRK